MGFWAAIPILGKIVESVLNIIDKSTIDATEKEKLKNQVQMTIFTQDHKEFMNVLDSQTKLIEAEAKSDSWLAKNWRPTTMLVFVGIVVSSWIGYVPPNMPDELLNTVFDIIKIGLGGYVVGRSVEKTAIPIIKIMKDKK